MRREVKGETWIDGPSALRRGKVRFADGRLRVVKLGIPDTYYSIPAQARINGRYVAGFVTVANDEFKFLEHK